ncbi:MAG: hypothetical protein Q4Q53_07865 [Methanocorpusculum sp.]|nr:hypothetical protein [Methanocorpusculum sp.]
MTGCLSLGGGKWDKPTGKTRFELGNGYTANITGAYNDGSNICGLTYYPKFKWELKEDGTTVNSWESDAEEDPETKFDLRIAPFIKREHLEDVRRRFLTSQIKNYGDDIVTKRASEIWESGNAAEYMFETCSKYHVGDLNLMKSIIYAYASTKIVNSDGIHISISGCKGSGKSHSVETATKCIPVSHVNRSRLSDKAILYHNIREGTMIVMDDQELTEPMQELIKVHTTDWANPPKYMTVNSGKPLELDLAPRCPYVICKANLNGDDQILDRQIVFWTDESDEQKRAIRDSLMKKARFPQITEDEERDMIICRAIWAFVPTVTVTIPFTDRIDCSLSMDARNINLFLSLIKANAILHASARDSDDDGNLVACEDDFYAAADIMNPLLDNSGGSQLMKLSRNASKVLGFLKGKQSGEYSFAEIRRNTGLSDAQLSQALNGRQDSKTDGLLNSCNAVSISSISETTGDEYSKTTSSGNRAVKWSKDTYEVFEYMSRGWFVLRKDRSDFT